MIMLDDSRKYYAQKPQQIFQQPLLLDYQVEDLTEVSQGQNTIQAEGAKEAEQGQNTILMEDTAEVSQAQNTIQAEERERSVIHLLSSRNQASKEDEVELGPLPAVDLEFVLACLRDNEWGDARLFARLFSGRCVHDASQLIATRGWHLWQGHSWEESEENYVRHLVSGPLATVYQKASELVIEQSASETNTAQLKEREQQIKQLKRRAEQLRALQRTDNVLGYAHSILSTKTSKWDSHPWLLGTKQGVIDLRTGTLRPGQPDDHQRTLIPTAWKGLDEPAPRFMQFLSEIFSDRAEEEREELIAFLQRALGYGITGNVSEHIFLMLYGEEGRNGKDTLMHALEYVLGKTVGAVSNDVLITAGRSTTPGAAKPHLCSLQGKRIAWISESSREARFAIEQIKQLTGGGEIVARQIYTREYTFAPSHLLILLTNYRPEADAADSAFWERLCPLVFNTRFVEQPERANERLRDTQLGVALEAEASGILAWLVRGALEWTRLGLAIPESVRNARQEYRSSESSAQDFIDQCCVLAAEARTPANLLYKRYKRWASENDLAPISNKQFVREMKASNIASKRSKHGIFYIGISLAKEADSAD